VTTERRHDIDTLRVLAFASLILYHCAMAYVAGSGWGWHVKSSYQADWLHYPMLLINRWRMPLLFLISGIAVHFLRRRHSLLKIAGLRSRRLLLPLVFGIFVVVPIQPYCQGLYNGKLMPGFWHFLLHYWHLGPWPKDAFDGWQFGVTWNHLWYLPYLWAYTMVILALLPLLESSAGRRFCAAVQRLDGAALLVLPAIPKMLALHWLADRFPDTHALFDDWFSHAWYFTYFLYGYLLGSGPELAATLERRRWTTLRLALLCYLLYPLYLTLGDDLPDGLWSQLGQEFVSGMNTWLWIATVLGWSRHWLNRPFRWLPYANEAIFPWYMLHQSLIVPAVYFLAPRKLGPVVEPLLVVTITVAGCFLLHEYLIRPTRWLRPWFGLAPSTPTVRGPSVAARHPINAAEIQ
jgi:peptidoglycan/LPS O-acetylase OafA/YrhL